MYFFSTKENLTVFSEATDIYANEYLPQLFYQVLNEHAFKHGKQFLLAYFLLPRKIRDIYNIVFLLLKESVLSKGNLLAFMPQRYV